MRTALFATLLMLAGCSTDPTQVMLVVDGEFVTPDEVDAVDIVVTAPNGDSRVVADVPLDAVDGFPRILGILPGEGGSGEYRLVVTAKRAGATVVRRTAAFRFRRDEIRMLRVDLVRACQGVVCSGSDRTCVDMGLCDRIKLETEAWEGTPSSQLDAGVGP